MNPAKRKFDVCIIGGAGHVGLPLALVFASRGLNVLIIDSNSSALQKISRGDMPFLEEGAPDLLRDMLKKDRLHIANSMSEVQQAQDLIITVGTPIDEFMNPSLTELRDCLNELVPFLRDDHLLVLRSTVYPGVTEWLGQFLLALGKTPQIAFCPERVVQGFAIKEVQEFPQIISGLTPAAEQAAENLFKIVAPKTIRLKPKEAEFAKLFCNAFRYIQFAIANQFYMMANSSGVNFHKILNAIKDDYPRTKDIPVPGLTGGPCLLKDTLQLAAFSNHAFTLGQAALLVNEGLVLHLVGEIERNHRLSEMTVGLLGMAFKADCDDIRSSLSYKLKKALAFRARKVLTTDPHVTTDPDLLPLEKVLTESDFVILCVPHTAYRSLDIEKRKIPYVDPWGFWLNSHQDRT